jgi:hypothetical protein
MSHDDDDTYVKTKDTRPGKILLHMSIQWRNSPLPGQGRLAVRFLDHAQGLLGRVISLPQGGQAITLRKFLIIPDPLTRVLWQLDQQRHLVAKQGNGQETWELNFAYRASLHSYGPFTFRKSTTWDRLLHFPSEERHA